MKQPEQALAEYKTDLKFYPNRFNGLYGAAQAAEMAGQMSQATEYYAVLVKTCEGSTSERPELAKAKQAVLARSRFYFSITSRSSADETTACPIPA